MRISGHVTAVPSRIRSVVAAMPPMTLQTKALSPCASIQGWKWSEIIAKENPSSSARFDALIGSTSTYEVNAVDGVGRLSATVSLRFTAGLGIVDGTGRLLRDTVPPAPVTKVTVRKLAKRIVLTWAPARDSGGLLGYRVRVGSRLLATAKETLSLPRSHVTAPISIVAVDQAGNAGPATRVPLSRLR